MVLYRQDVELIRVTWRAKSRTVIKTEKMPSFFGAGMPCCRATTFQIVGAGYCGAKTHWEVPFQAEQISIFLISAWVGELYYVEASNIAAFQQNTLEHDLLQSYDKLEDLEDMTDRSALALSSTKKFMLWNMVGKMERERSPGIWGDERGRAENGISKMNRSWLTNLVGENGTNIF